ncbi:unnamed protein product [Calicophoron daubneyi]|uniref:Ig-like domain-containing protein n=1 Tax=Calicophoron daubneyi TaxID=300641 RepID=A0AAV2TFW4_CALDB
MIRWLILTVLWIEFSTTVINCLSPTRLRAFCSTPDTIGVVGGNHDRLVTEGGRVTLTCCMPGDTHGHDHEQLVWFDPQNQELTNHFANPNPYPDFHVAYSVPDFRSTNHLVTNLVIQNFRKQDSGQYSCRKADPRNSVPPVAVSLAIRPRLLVDFAPMAPEDPADSGAAVVAGPPVFVALEEGRPGQIECHLNPTIPSNEIQLTWYFQGRQLIAPAHAIVRTEQTRPIGLEFESEGRVGANEKLRLLTAESGLVNEGQRSPAERPYESGGLRPVSLDPAELGIHFTDRGQVLNILNVGDKHSGVYFCKAEAINPTYAPERSKFDPPSYESGVIEDPLLVQVQAIRGIVFSPPRILPGSPKEVSVPRTDEPPLLLDHNDRRKRAERLDEPSNPMVPAARYYMQPAPEHAFRHQLKPGHQLLGQVNSVAKEGGQLVLECQARGKPNPQILWFRGGMGSVMIGDSKAVTFDQRIKEALQYLNLEDVQKQMGTLIANGQRLYPAIAHPHSSDNVGESVPLADSESGQPQVEEGIRYKLGRFQLGVGVRRDDTGDPVITVSRLTINHLQASDATRYTCLALLDLSQYGGNGNYTDVGSVLPEVVLRPRFIKSGTRLQASGYPGENATLSCEAYGGLANPRGLQIRLLRGSGLPKLLRMIAGSRDEDVREWKQGEFLNYDVGQMTDLSAISPASRGLRSKIKGSTHSKFENPYEEEGIEKSIEVLQPNYSPRYHLTVVEDPRNPYASLLRLHITNLQPEDNAYYACEAVTGSHWRTIAPSPSDSPGRLTVWFAPPSVRPEGTGGFSGDDLNETATDELNEDLSKVVVYGLSHLPSKLVCKALGQPPPEWVWIGPQTGPNVHLGEADGKNGYKKVEFQDGELSVSELTLPASYSNVGVFGTYSCTAKNRLGSATGYIRLKLATHPDRPSLRACKLRLGWEFTHVRIKY